MVKIKLNLKYPNALFKGIGTQFGPLRFTIQSTLPSLLVGRGLIIKEGGGSEVSAKFLNWGVMINGGRRENLGKKAKFGPKLQEFIRITTI